MRLLEHFFRLLAPYDCLRCGQEGSLICSWCIEDALPQVLERCYRCNKLSSFGKTCASCRRNSPIKHVWIRTEYTKSTKALVHIMKFKYSGEAADLIANELMNTIPALPPNTIIVHVPTATNHIRERGYDHAERIARKIAVGTGLRHLPLLVRTSQVRQVGSKREQRLSQMKSAFRSRFDEIIRGAHIVLIDDVLTSGATIEAAARTLKHAGAASIDAAIFASAKQSFINR